MPGDDRPLPHALLRSVVALASVALTGAAAMTAAAGTASPAVAATGDGPGGGRAVGVARGAIGGVVRGPDGAGPGRICVVASGASGPAATVTEPGGRYLITGLAPGAYTVGYRDCSRPRRYLNEWYGGSLQPDGATRVVVTPGRPTSLSPVTLRPARAATMRALARAAALRNAAQPAAASSRPSISGVVTNAAGKGLIGVCVTASSHTANSAFATGTATGRGGHYRLPLSAHVWKVSFANGCGGKYAPQWWKHAKSAPKATPIRLRKGSHITGIDARLVVGGVITGTVRAGSPKGRGLRGVCVFAEGSGRAAGIFQQAVSHAGGSYRITGLGTGPYRVQFFAECGTKGSYLDRSVKAAATDGKTTAGVNTFLVPAAEIRGTVTAAAGGTPLAGICVFALPVTGQQGNVLVALEQTGKNGGYTITGLPHGKYIVSFSGGCGNRGSYAPQYYNGQAQAAAANLVRLATGQHVTGIDARMQPGGTITGTVTDRSDTGLAGICVAATSAQDAGDVGASPEGLLLSTFPVFSDLVVTGSTGGYRLANLAPGSYEVSFTSGCGRRGATSYAAQW